MDPGSFSGSLVAGGTENDIRLTLHTLGFPSPTPRLLPGVNRVSITEMYNVEMCDPPPEAGGFRYWRSLSDFFFGGPTTAGFYDASGICVQNGTANGSPK